MQMRLFLNITQVNRKDSLQLIDTLRRTIESELVERNKKNDEFEARLKEAEKTKQALKQEFQTQLKVEEEIRLQVDKFSKIP